MESRFERWMSRWPACCADVTLTEPAVLGHLGTGLGRFAKLRFQGKARGQLFVRLRADLKDDSADDDWIELEFAPANIDFSCVVTKWLGMAVLAFEPYLAQLASEADLIDQFSARMSLQQSHNTRHRLLNFYPGTYLSDALCRRSFELEAGTVQARVSSICRATLIGNGVLIAMADQELDSTAVSEFRARLGRALGP